MKNFLLATGAAFLMASCNLYGQQIIEITQNDVTAHLDDNSTSIIVKVVRNNLYGNIVVQWPGQYGKVASDGRLVSGTDMLFSDIGGMTTTLTGSRTSQVYETTISLGSLDLEDFFGSPFISRRVHVGNLTAKECVDGFWSEFVDPVGGDYGFVCFGDDIITSESLPLYIELADPRIFTMDENFMGDECYDPEPSFGDYIINSITNLHTSKELEILLQSGASTREAESCAQFSKCMVIDRSLEGEGDVMARALFTFESADWDNLTADWSYDYPIDGSFTKIGSIRERPQVDAGSNEAYCAGSGQQQLSALSDGGVWTDVEGYVSESGVFDTDVAPVGHHTVYYTITDGFGCTNVDSKVVTVHGAPAISIADMTVCAESGIVPLVAEPVGGQWSGSGHLDGSNFNTTEAPTGAYSLIYTLTDENGCTSTASMILTVSPLPIVEAGEDVEVCISESELTLTGASPAGDNWSGEFMEQSIFYIEDAGIGDHVVFYSYEDDNGCEVSDSRVIMVLPNPVADAGEDIELCFGGVTELMGSASGGNGSSYTYRWWPAARLDDPDVANTSASPEEDETYTVTVTDEKGCASKDDVTLIVNELPEIRITADGFITDAYSICPGISVYLKATGGEEYLWEPAEGFNNPYFDNPVAQPTESTLYTVTVKDNKGCTAQKSIDITVKTPPALSMGDDLLLCVNDSPYDLRQDVNIEGGVFKGEGVEGVFFFPDAVSPNVYTLSYEINVDGCVVTAYREVQVFGLPEVGFSEEEVVMCVGDSVVLRPLRQAQDAQDDTLPPLPPPSSGGEYYKWAPVVGLSDPAIPNPVASPGESTVYTLTVTDENGCSGTGEVNVEVIAPRIDAGVNQEICEGETVQLQASGGEYYEWSSTFATDYAEASSVEMASADEIDSSLNDKGISNPVASPIQTSTYTVTGTDSNGCTGTDEVTVSVNPLPEISTGDPVKLCQSDPSFDLRQMVSPTGGVFEGEGVDGVLIKPSLLEPGIYLINYTLEANGCSNSSILEIEILKSPEALVLEEHITSCPGEDVQLIASGGTTYSWVPSEGLSNTEIANPVATPDNSTLYKVTVGNDNGCTSTEQVYVELHKPAIHAGVDQETCAGGSVQLQALGGEIYSWSPVAGLTDATISNPVAKPTETTTYTVISTDDNGCTGTDEITITVLPAPHVSAGSPLHLCVNSDPYDLRQDVNITGGVFEGEGVDGVLLRAEDLDEGIYFIDYTVESEGCVVTVQREVVVNGLPEVGFEEEVEQVVVCKGDSVVLTPPAPPSSGGEFYMWLPDGGLSDAEIANPVASPWESTVYTLTVTDENGCSASGQVLVEVTDAVATVSGDVVVCPGESAVVSASGGVEYKWFTSSGFQFEGSTESEVVLRPDSTTVFTVTVTDPDGCVDSAEVTVTVKEPEAVDAGEILELCVNSEAYDLRQDVSVAGGVFKGEGVDGVLLRTEKLDEGIYFIDYTMESEGCVVTVQREVRVHGLPEVGFGEDEVMMCRRDSVKLTTSIPTLRQAQGDYKWFPEEGLSSANISDPMASPGVSTVYTLTITDENGCSGKGDMKVEVIVPRIDAGVSQVICEGETVQLKASGGEYYEWSSTFATASADETDSSLNDKGISNPVASPTVTTNYSVTVIDENGCTGADEVTVTVNPLPEITTGDPVKLCQSVPSFDLRQMVSQTGGVFEGEGVDGVLIKPSELEPGIYLINYTLEANGCSNSSILEIEILKSPEALVPEEHIISCPGEEVQLLASGGTTYSWVPSEGLSKTEIANPIVTPLKSTLYTVTVGNDNGCTLIEQVYVGLHKPAINAGVDKETCAGGAVQLQASGSDIYSWSPVAGLTDATISNPVAKPTETTTYTVISTDDNGCTGTDEITITVLPAPHVSAGSPLHLCVNSEPYDLRQDVNITGGVFEGEGVDGVLLRAEDLDEGIYFIDYTVESEGCVVTVQREVVVNGLPEVGFEEEVEQVVVCKGDSVVLTPPAPPSSGGEFYRWLPEEGLSDLAIPNPVASPGESTVYTLTVTDENGCSASGQVLVEVTEAVATVSGDVVVCPGKSAVVSASGGVEYVWSSTYAKASADESNSDFQFAGSTESEVELSPDSTTVFNVTVTDSNGCVDSGEVTVTVKEPEAVDAGGILELCVNSEAYDLRQDVNVEGGVFEGEGVDGVLLRAEDLDEGIYFIDYTVESEGCVVTAQREVQVFGLPEVVLGEDEVMMCKADSTMLPPLPPPSSGGEYYKWLPEGGLSDAEIANPVASPGESTVYTLTVTDENGCSASGQVLVEVTEAVATVSGDVVVCPGESAVVSASGGVDYKWFYDTGLQPAGSTESEVVLSPDSTTVFTVTVTDSNGCTDSEGVTVTVKVPEEVDAGDILELCVNSEAYDLRQDINIEGGVFEGEGVDGVLLRAEELGEGIYFIDYTVESEGCVVTVQREVRVHGLPEVGFGEEEVVVCKGDSVVLRQAQDDTQPPLAPPSTGGEFYKWAPEEGLSDPEIYNPVASPGESMVYKLTITDEKGCSGSGDVRVEVIAPRIDAGVNQVICEGETVQLQASGGEYYEWIPDSLLNDLGISNPVTSPTQTTSYTVTGTDRDGCTATDDITVTVLPKPEIKIDGPLMLCNNDEPADLRNYVSLEGGTFTGEAVEGVLVDPAKLDLGIYFVTYTVEENGCEDSGELEVRVHGLPEVGFGEEEVVVCAGDSVVLRPLRQAQDAQDDTLPPLAPPSSGGEFYKWVPVEGLSDPEIYNPVASPGESTVYTLTVTNDKNCIASGFIDVVIEDVGFDAGADFEVCINALPVELPQHEGGAWYGEGIVNNIFDPLSAGIGQAKVFYSKLSTNNCLLTDSLLITVLDEPALEAGDAREVCRDALPVNLIGDVSLAGGTFEGTGITGHFFDPGKGDAVNIITYKLRYHGCELQAYREIIVRESTKVDFGDDIDLCIGSGPYDLSGSINIPGGTMEGEFVEGNMFYPESTGHFAVDYKFMNAYGCISEAQKIINVVSPKDVDAGPDQSLCTTVSSLDLIPLGNPTGGRYFGEHVKQDLFDTDAALPGDHIIYYSYDNGNGCVSYDSLTITIHESPIEDFGADTLLCLGTEALMLNFSENLTRGVWSGGGVVNNIFHSYLAGEGSHLLTYRNEDVVCDIAGTRTITVAGLPAFAISEQHEITACVGDIVVLEANLPESEINKNTSIAWYDGQERIGFGKTFRHQVMENKRVGYKSVSSFGCASDQESFIAISTDNPSGEIAVSDSTPQFGVPVQFSVKDLKNAVSYLWDFGDGMYSYEEKPWHFYYATDTFTISLKLTSSSGCETEIRQEYLIIVGDQPGVSDEKGKITGIDSRLYENYRGALQVIALFPHPAGNEVTVGMAVSGNGSFDVRISNLNGTLLKQSAIYLKSGYNEVSLFLDGLEAGLYVMHIKGEKEETNTKIYKK